MKRKFLAVVVTAAMVAGALPGIALAAPADEYKTETQETPDSQEDFTMLHWTTHRQRAARLCLSTAEPREYPER